MHVRSLPTRDLNRGKLCPQAELGCAVSELLLIRSQGLALIITELSSAKKQSTKYTILALPFQSSLQSLDLPRCRARLRLQQVSALPLTELGSAAYQSSALPLTELGPAAYQSSALLLCIAQLCCFRSSALLLALLPFIAQLCCFTKLSSATLHGSALLLFTAQLCSICTAQLCSVCTAQLCKCLRHARLNPG